MNIFYIFIFFFSYNSYSKTIALFDHQINNKYKIPHKIINYNPSISSSNDHATHLLCGLKSKINLYLYPFLEFNDNSQYFKFLKEAINLKVDYIWIPSSSKVFSRKEFEYFKLANKLNIKILTSAGNDGLDLGKHPVYPCSYNLSNVICIQTEENFSNKSKNGFKIKNSSLMDCNNSQQKGTSQATVIYLNQNLD